MRHLTLIVFFLIYAISIHGQSCKKKYKAKLEPGSKLIDCDGNYTIEKLNDGTCIMKTYYPETKMITKFMTFKNDKFEERHGIFKEFWDDGTLVNKGEFQHNLKEGTWVRNRYETGEYKNDKKIGLWKSIGEDSIVTQEEMYVDGALHGKKIMYDSLGIVSVEEEYQYGILISTTQDTTIQRLEQMPRFPGCEDLDLSSEELDECAKQKLLQYMYSSLRYPRKAREQNIEGSALFQFVVNKEGEIQDITTLSGISKDIKKVAIDLIEKMPKWIPGTQDGKPVKVLYTLPLRFKLEN